jgi:hypothetical protein
MAQLEDCIHACSSMHAAVKTSSEAWMSLQAVLSCAASRVLYLQVFCFSFNYCQSPSAALNTTSGSSW